MAKPADLNSNLFFLLSCLAVITLLLLASYNFTNYLLSKKVLGIENNLEEILKEKNFWNEFLAKNQTYYDGWIELSKLESELGNTQKAKDYSDKAKEINPNFSVSPRPPELPPWP